MRIDLTYIDDGQLHFHYPCPWMYKLIGFDAGKIHEAVADLLPTGRYMLSFSNFSARGKYICLNLNTVVQSENERNDLFNDLKAHQDIRMVL